METHGPVNFQQPLQQEAHRVGLKKKNYLRCPRNLILYSMHSVIHGSVYHSGKLDSAMSKSEILKIRKGTATLKCTEL